MPQQYLTFCRAARPSGSPRCICSSSRRAAASAHMARGAVFDDDTWNIWAFEPRRASIPLALVGLIYIAGIRGAAAPHRRRVAAMAGGHLAFAGGIFSVFLGAGIAGSIMSPNILFAMAHQVQHHACCA